jgi:DNA-binding MarR family transcriptional regulator
LTSMLKEKIYSQPGHLIRRAHQLAWAVFMNETAGFEITPVQYAALVAIADHPGIDATRLSEYISFDRATIGNVVERMESKDLIRRKNGDRDRRTKKIFLARRGRAMITSLKPLVPRIARGIFARLDRKEQQHLLRLLGKVVEIVDAERRASAPDPTGEQSRAGSAFPPQSKRRLKNA